MAVHSVWIDWGNDEIKRYDWPTAKQSNAFIDGVNTAMKECGLTDYRVFTDAKDLLEYREEVGELTFVAGVERPEGEPDLVFYRVYDQTDDSVRQWGFAEENAARADLAKSREIGHAADLWRVEHFGPTVHETLVD